MTQELGGVGNLKLIEDKVNVNTVVMYDSRAG